MIRSFFMADSCRIFIDICVHPEMDGYLPVGTAIDWRMNLSKGERLMCIDTRKRCNVSLQLRTDLYD